MPRLSRTSLAALGATLALVGAASASARVAALPTLFVNYTMSCAFTITDDGGARVATIPAGTYQVIVQTPVVFANVDRIIKEVVETVGPKMTQTEVKLDKVELSTTSGTGKLSGLLIGNPKGFTTPSAMQLGEIGLTLDIGSLSTDTIVIKSILIRAPRRARAGEPLPGVGDRALVRAEPDRDAGSGEPPYVGRVIKLLSRARHRVLGVLRVEPTRLVVLSRDLSKAVPVPTIAPTMQSALDRWEAVEPELRRVSDELNAGRARDAIAFDPKLAHSPLPRSYMVFASDGEMRPLSLLRRENMAESTRVMSAETAQQIRKMLELVVLPGGTAPKAQVAGYRVGGKTGTAHKLDGASYAADKYVSSFVGLAPASAPRLIVAVMIDEPTAGGYYGGTVAAPVFSQTVQQTLRMLEVQPDMAVKPQVVAKAEAESF